MWHATATCPVGSQAVRSSEGTAAGGGSVGTRQTRRDMTGKTKGRRDVVVPQRRAEARTGSSSRHRCPISSVHFERERDRGKRRGRRGAVLLVVAVVIAVVAVCAIRVHRVHDAGWEWRLTPSAAPPKVHFAGRDYHRSSLGAPVPPSWSRQGSAPGGGVVYAPEDSRGRTHVVIFVRDGRQSYGYDLMGGP